MLRDEQRRLWATAGTLLVLAAAATPLGAASRSSRSDRSLLAGLAPSLPQRTAGWQTERWRSERCTPLSPCRRLPTVGGASQPTSRRETRWSLDLGGELRRLDVSVVRLYENAERASFGRAQRKERPTDDHNLGVRMVLPVSPDWKLSGEALQSVDARGRHRDSALRMKAAGSVQDLQVEAGVQSVGERFRSVGDPTLRSGDRAHLRVARRTDDWRLGAKAKLERPARPGAPGVASYGLDAGMELPGALRSRLSFERRESPSRQQTRAGLTVRRRVAKLDIGVQHRETSTRQGSSVTTAQVTGLDVRFPQVGGWSVTGGTTVEQRVSPRQAVAAHQLFVAPRWKSREENLSLRLRLGIDVEDLPGDRERRRLQGKTSLTWKLRDEGVRADLAMDLSVGAVEDGVRSVLDRRAALRLTCRLGPAGR